MYSIILAAAFNCVAPTPPAYQGNWHDDVGSLNAHSAQYTYQKDFQRYVECLNANQQQRIEDTEGLYGQGEEN